MVSGNEIAQQQLTEFQLKRAYNVLGKLKKMLGPDRLRDLYEGERKETDKRYLIAKGLLALVTTQRLKYVCLQRDVDSRTGWLFLQVKMLSVVRSINKSGRPRFKMENICGI